MLKVGAQFTLGHSRRQCSVRRFIGEGGQGSVFEVELGGGDLGAVKWYFRNTATDAQRWAIWHLIDRGAPDHSFLWPTELIELPGTEGFGYLMNLRPPTSTGLSDLLRGKVDAPFSVVCTLGMGLSSSFLNLHSQGLCYRDISFGNIFFDPITGQPLICDNDNVGIDGESPSMVLGTRRFMAPEIVRREANPSISTDLYSLSVLLFYLLMVGHPLEGRRELDFAEGDPRKESELFGSRPLFVFDPEDASNEPVEGWHGSVLTNWHLYPLHIRELFTSAFTVGLRDRDARIRESVWRRELSRLRDSITRCPNCKKENFWHAGEQRRCWLCERPIDDPLRLEVGNRSLVLTDNTVIRRHHLHGDYDFVTPIGTIIEHPQRPGRWGIRNDTALPWQVTLPSGEHTTAEPQRTVGLLPGTTLQVGAVTARLAI